MRVRACARGVRVMEKGGTGLELGLICAELNSNMISAPALGCKLMPRVFG